MRVVIQRVLEAQVAIDFEIIGKIGKGLVVLVGIEEEDTTDDLVWLCNKIVNLRIFDDENKVPNLSVKDVNGEILVVSQFTLHASTKKGNRPSYIKASKPEHALPLYEHFVMQLETDLGKIVSTGTFGADMNVKLINHGPVTIIIDSKLKE
jgi:D-aminoacyl-tRNA deacylase